MLKQNIMIMHNMQNQSNSNETNKEEIIKIFSRKNKKIRR